MFEGGGYWDTAHTLNRRPEAPESLLFSLAGQNHGRMLYPC